MLSNNCNSVRAVQGHNSYEATTQLPLVDGQIISWWMEPQEWYAHVVMWSAIPVIRIEPYLAWALENIDYISSTIWNLALIWAITWLIYRAYQVYQKPVSELVEVLGIDIPPSPELALSTIGTDSVLLYWKPPENYHSPLKHFVQVNGINVGEFNRSDASIQVTGLKPGNYYEICAIARNAAGFSSYGLAIPIRTIPLTGAETPQLLARLEAVKNYKRVSVGSRRSPSTTNPEQTNGHIQHPGTAGEEPGSEETMAFLTRKLDSLRHQQEEIDKSNAEEMAENERNKATMMKERDELKQKVEEKERAHLEFKKQVNEFEKQVKAKQRIKSAKERLLQQKKAERQKKLDDIARWKAEAVEICKDKSAMQKEKADLMETHEKKMAATRHIIDEANADNKVLEEEIREFGIKIKEIEDQKKKEDQEQSEEEAEAERREREEEEAHEKRIQEYQAKIAMLWKANQQALLPMESECGKLDDRLNFWLTKRAKEPHLFAPIPGLDFPVSSTAHSSRRMRQGTSRASNLSQSSSGYPNTNSAFNSTSSASPIFPSTSASFGVNNPILGGMSTEQSGMSDRDIEALTGGGLLSPTANMLLPSNLLRDDDHLSGQMFNQPSQHGIDNGSISHTANPYIPSNIDTTVQDPQSPMSMNSRSPSLVSSPHESARNSLGYYTSRDQVTDYDRRSVSSTSSPFASGLPAETNPLHGRRLTGLFNFNRQRGKSSINEPPSLGTLKQGQSQSFPRNLEQNPLDPISAARRRLGSGTWTNPMSTFLARNISGSGNGVDGDPSTRPNLGPHRKSRLHMFGSKLEPADQLTPIDKTNSPARPSSTYSFENTLPRPSSESQPFGWGLSDSTHQRSSPLVADWTSVGGPWSRNQSRRASVQHDSTSNLSLGSTPLDPDDYSSPFANKMSPPAPIGTGRKKAKDKATTPRLNPAAPSFTTRLFSRNETKKGPSSKGKEIDKQKDSESDYMPDDSSPTNSRLSRDAYSIATATSESHDSLDQSLSPSTSDIANSSTPKETLMQRITRKSSSSKFNVPWSKERGTSLFSKKGEPSTPGEIDEDGSGDQLLGKSIDSAASTPQHERGGRASLSWSRVMRKAKKGEKEASESGEPETGDDEA